MKQRKRVKRRGKVARLQASAGGRKLPPGTCAGVAGIRPTKKAVTLRLDGDVLAWRMVPRQGRGYQTRINRALRKLMSKERKTSGNELGNLGAQRKKAFRLSPRRFGRPLLERFPPLALDIGKPRSPQFHDSPSQINVEGYHNYC